MSLEKRITLEKLVTQMIEESNNNPRDFCFRYIVNTYPKAVHDAFDFPGEYMNNLKLDVYTEDGRNLEMDCAQLIMPKGEITCKSTINVEHQTYPIREKVESIYDYKLYLIHKTNIPSNSIVMTNIDPGKDEIFCKSHDQIFKLKVNVVTREKISKRLKKLKNKIKKKKKLTQKDAMYFAYIAIFTKQKETMVRLAYLFSQIDQMEPNLQLDLHQVLKKMIKFHFREDINKIRELLTMISESIFQKNLEGLTYKERTEIQKKEKDQKLEEKDQKLEEKDEKLKEQGIKLEEKDQKLEEKDEKLEEKDLKLKEKNKENQKLKKEIEKLKKQINR